MGLREKAVEEFTEELLHMTYREISLALARYQLPMNNIFRSNVFINAFRVSSQLKVRPLSSHRQNFDQTRLFAASSSEEQQPLDLKPGPQSEVPTETRQVSKRIGDLVDQIASLSILEVSDLNYELRKRLNLPEFSAMSAGMIMGSVAQRQDGSLLFKDYLIVFESVPRSFICSSRILFPDAIELEEMVFTYVTL